MPPLNNTTFNTLVYLLMRSRPAKKTNISQEILVAKIIRKYSLFFYLELLIIFYI